MRASEVPLATIRRLRLADLVTVRNTLASCVLFEVAFRRRGYQRKLLFVVDRSCFLGGFHGPISQDLPFLLFAIYANATNYSDKAAALALLALIQGTEVAMTNAKATNQSLSPSLSCETHATSQESAKNSRLPT